MRFPRETFEFVLSFRTAWVFWSRQEQHAGRLPAIRKSFPMTIDRLTANKIALSVEERASVTKIKLSLRLLDQLFRDLHRIQRRAFE